MDLKRLYYFVTVVNEGNISHAAKKLHMSQPPLSTQMHLLEKELSCTLFERGSRQIHLTEAGKLLYERALTMLELSSQTKKELLDYQNGTTGSLRLGVISSVSCTFLNQWIKSFHHQRPEIHFELFEANTYQLLEQLKANIIEIAIVRTPFHSASFECIFFQEEPMLAVGHRIYFDDLPQHEISLRQLYQKPLILYRRWEAIILEQFQLHHLHPQILCKNDDARTTAYWADAGLGIGIIPASALKLVQNPDTLCRELRDPELHSKISVIYNKNGYLSPVAREFLTFLQSV
ncbi:MAG: LysR family transcriptional regulator [Lachnospiraceae bacterium]|nr:LysR family transcriptional regulator [Robinsoniella sp.]MDY3765084.1 LysR family transcriptional regulator [Lachnospiraceae bacterium]